MTALPAFASPWLLLTALLVPIALLLGRGGPAVVLPPARFAVGLPRTLRSRLAWLPRALAALGLLLAVAALARPVERVAVPAEKEGIDILLCLDVSSSMAADDLAPGQSRLDVAKEEASRFVADRPDDRIGLIRFARYPDLRCPPTPDHDALVRMLDDVTLVTGDGPEDATGIGTAIARAAQVLGGAGETSRVVVLLTDGEENVATADQPGEIAPVHAGQLCETLGVRVYTVVVGSGRRGPGGDWVALDTTQVRRLSEGTGGRFFAARDAAGVARVYAEIDALTRAPVAEPRFEIRERFLPFLAAAALLLLLGKALDARALAVLP